MQFKFVRQRSAAKCDIAALVRLRTHIIYGCAVYCPDCNMWLNGLHPFCRTAKAAGMYMNDAQKDHTAAVRVMLQKWFR